jgi:hypothetical protein
MMTTEQIKLVAREDREWEQVVYAELLVPNVLNVFNDLWSEEAIRAACYLFAKNGYGIDREHDNVDLTGKVYVVESFIARDGDPDFIKGSWVIGMKIDDPVIWQAVLDNEINGYSYEAVVAFIEATIAVNSVIEVSGFTEPSTEDGHTHAFLAFVGEDGRVHSGGTSEENGHYHELLQSTITEEADGHKHRYNIVKGVTE